MSRPLYSEGKNHFYSLAKRLGRLQSQSGRGGEEINPCLCRESNPRRPTHSLITVLTELPGSAWMLNTSHYSSEEVVWSVYDIFVLVG